ncbi:MAG: 2,3-bisphosphoglycerate-independent phosphoglycerate mutase [Pseudomonadota bacterium]
MRPVCIIVRDGWGYNEDPRGNAVLAAHTPTMDKLKAEHPWTLLDASGEPVGLPEGYQGSSEVGHLNMGAGRIVIQELKRIDDGLSDGSLFQLPKWKGLMEKWGAGRGRLHLLGLLQDEGVHAHQEHLFKIMRRARGENPAGEIVIHPFLDGRDTPPRSCLEYLAQLKLVMDEVGGCRIGTVMGRYYAMDRSRDWRLTDLAFHCLVLAEGRPTPDSETAVRTSYAQDKTPDDMEMSDEYIPPYVVAGYDGIRDGDCVFHTNFRQDRAYQLTLAFVDPAYPGNPKKRPQVQYLGFTRYYNELTEYLIGPMGSGGGMDMLLGEVISRAGLQQLRISETQKYRHVTSFFNGKSTTPYPGQDNVEIKGRFDPSSFASHPEMEAYILTDRILKILENNPYRFILVNYPNCDMVGHTGVFEAAKKAVEIVDLCLGRIVPRLLELDFQVLITADHGNAEQMVDYRTGMVKTSHTTFPVECVLAARDSAGKKLIDRGKLSDISVTALELMGLAIPPEMSARSLLA